jgi:hypothetical protein
MAATPTAMDVVSLREDIGLTLFVDAVDLRMAAGAGSAMQAARKVAERLAGAG